jgi:hypothetical protein
MAQEQTDRELHQIEERWRRGEYQPGPSLTVEPDGTLVLRADPGMMRLTPTDVVFVPPRGRPDGIPRSDIDRVVVVSVELGSLRAQPARLMLFIDRRGRCLRHRFVSGVPRPDQLLFAAALGVRAEIRDESVGPDELRAQYPGSLPAIYQYQVAIGLVAAGVVLAVGLLIGYVLHNMGILAPSG